MSDVVNQCEDVPNPLFKRLYPTIQTLSHDPTRNDPNMTGHIIIVEGIIGAGKSTFAAQLADYLGCPCKQEPVEDNPYLERFYEDPSGWAFPMQMHMLLRRHAMHQEAAWMVTGGAKAVVLDRSLPGDRVFAHLHARKGNITPLEMQTYELAFQLMLNGVRPPSFIVYLDVKPEQALQRVLERGRRAERLQRSYDLRTPRATSVDLDYLTELEQGYDRMLNAATRGYGDRAWRGTEALVLNWNTLEDGSHPWAGTRLNNALAFVASKLPGVEDLDG